MMHLNALENDVILRKHAESFTNDNGRPWNPQPPVIYIYIFLANGQEPSSRCL